MRGLVSLVVLPFFRKEATFNVHFPISLFSIATALKEVKIRSTIVDFQLLIKSGSLSFGKGFFKDAAGIIAKGSPDIVGFTSNCVQFPIVVALARVYKKRYPNTKIILGGPQASVTDILTMSSFPWFDVIVRGDGENTIKELCSNILGNKPLDHISGITWRDHKGHIHRNTNRALERDLDAVPYPDYGIQPTIGPYLSHTRTFPIEAGRGCPFKCKFCHYSNPRSNYTYRLRSASNIVRHMRTLNRTYGIQDFIIEHDNFTFNPKRLAEFCSELKKSSLPAQWYCDSRLESLNSRTIKMLAETGCRSIFIGVESASSRIQKGINKRMQIDNIYSIIEECNLNSIKCRVAFMIGFPEEDETDVNMTLEMMLKLVLEHPENDIVFNIVHPHFGSTYYNAFINDLELVRPQQPVIDVKYDYIPKKFYNMIHTHISKRPDLFSYFYCFNTGLNKPLFNLSLQEYYPMILKHYPRTFYTACKTCKKEPLELYEQLYRRYLRSVTRQQNDDIETFFHKCFTSFILDRSKTHRTIAIKNILREETKGAGSRSRNKATDYSSKNFFKN